jgi:hypothetical protein
MEKEIQVALHLKRGTRLADGAARLRDCAIQANNISGTSAGQQPRLHATSYFNWVTATEGQVRNLFSDPDLAGHLRSTSYWAIRNPAFQDFRAIELINTEVTEQAEWLKGLADQLGELEQRLKAAPGVITVLDTNVLLHYQAPDQVDWPKVVGVDQVRLVLPLRVIEELDDKKYARRQDNVPDRARRLLSQLWAKLGPKAVGPVELRENVTIEVPIETGPRSRPLDADTEILDTCEEISNVGQEVVLVTGDNGLGLRALHLGLRVVRMPDDYLRNKPEPES